MVCGSWGSASASTCSAAVYSWDPFRSCSDSNTLLRSANAFCNLLHRKHDLSILNDSV